MQSFRKFLIGLSIAGAALTAPLAGAPAQAAVNATEPKAFIETLGAEGFGALRTGNQAAAKARFRTLLSQHFAVNAIGDSLIANWKAKLTPAQLADYRATFPTYIVGTYADLLFEYGNADFVVKAARPNGAATEVVSQVTKKGSSPIVAVWRVNQAGGVYKVSNLTVAGINLVLNQRQAFNARIQRDGFDKFLAWMKSQA